MAKELAQRWPLDNPCSAHINKEENERLMKCKLEIHISHFFISKLIF